MEEELAEVEVRSPQQAVSEGFSSPASEASTGVDKSVATANCNTSSVLCGDSVAGGGMTSSYGIQALINNVHLGYVNSEQVVDANNVDEVDEVGAKYDEDSFPQESEILRSIPLKQHL